MRDWEPYYLIRTFGKTSIPDTARSVPKLEMRTPLETLSGADMEASIAMVSVTLRLSVSGG